MADLLAPGLWWLHGTRGSNVYLVEADDGQLALVDTGFASSAKPIVAELAAAAPSRALAAILITHMHYDHTGAAHAIRESTGARLVAGAGDCIERGGKLWLRSRVGRTHLLRLLTGHHEASTVDQPIAIETEVLPGIRAIPVPGHTPGSLAFVVDRLGAAFVGDLVISHGGRLTRSMRVANRDDHVYLETLNAFAAIAPESGFPGHGTPVLRGFGEQLRRLASQPRRRPRPGMQAERASRLLRFSKGMLRRRTAEPVTPPDDR